MKFLEGLAKKKRRFKKKFVLKYLSHHPGVAINFLRVSSNICLREANLDGLTSPQGFEDLTWLFSCNKANRGVVRLSFDEAAYLFKTIKSISRCRVLEIGRRHGGSTIILAAAADKNSKIYSVDVAPSDDDYLKLIFKKIKLNRVISLITKDINKLNLKNEFYDVIFIDGDHSYEGVRRDFLHCRKAVKKKGHLIFHDYSKNQKDVCRLVNEIKASDKMFKENKQVSTLIDFIKVKS